MTNFWIKILELSYWLFQLLVRLPEIRLIAMQAEEYLYYCHLCEEVPSRTLLMEMIQAQRQ